MTAAELEQPLFDYRELDSDDRAFVKERALRIRDAAKRTAEGIILIGQWLSEAKSRIKHGQWLPWLESEFGWSDQTARKFMHVFKRCKSKDYLNLELDVSALYLISAPKTPEPVRQEIIKRAEAGEPMTHAKAVEVLDSYKAKAEVPTPAVARQIALATGVPTLATNNTYVPPMTKREERLNSDEQAKVLALYRVMQEICECGLTPAEMVTLGHKYKCGFLGERAQKAAKWLLEVVEGMRR